MEPEKPKLPATSGKAKVVFFVIAIGGVMTILGWVANQYPFILGALQEPIYPIRWVLFALGLVLAIVGWWLFEKFHRER